MFKSFKSRTAILSLAVMVGVNATVLPVIVHAAQVVPNKKICVNYDPFTGTYKKEDGPKYNDPKVETGHKFLPADTIVPMKIIKDYDSRTAKRYEMVDMEVIEDVKQDGKVVIPKGTKAQGYVFVASKAGGFGKKGVLKIAGLELTTPEGIKVPLKDGLIGRGQNDGGAAAVAAAATIIGGAFMKGTNVICVADTEFECKVRADTDLGK